jgi:hypothetical protein
MNMDNGEMESTSLQNTVQEQFYKDMTKLLQESIMSDVTLVVSNGEEDDGEGKRTMSFPIHKCILCARSEYFNNMFRHEWKEAKSNVIYMTEKEPSDFKVLLDYFYTARININSENAFGVLKLADEFGVDIIKQQCINFVKEVVNNENVFDVLEESRYLNFMELVQFCKTFVDNHARELFFSDSFLKVEKSTVIEILKSDNIMANEIEIFLAIIQWGKAQVKQQQIVGTSTSNNPQSLDTKKRRKNMLSRRKRTGARSNQILNNNNNATETPILTRHSLNLASSIVDSESDSILTDVTRCANRAAPSAVVNIVNTHLSASEAQISSDQYPPSIPKKKNRKQTQSLTIDMQTLNTDNITAYLSVSEMTENVELTATESEMTDFDDNDMEELDTSIENMKPVRQLSDLLNLTITNSLSVFEPMSHVSSSPTPFQPSDMTQLKKMFANVLDYTKDKNFIKELSKIISDLMEYIRFPTLEPQELYELVEPSLVVPKNLLLEAYRCHALSSRTDIINKSIRMRVREGSLFYLPGVLENVPIKLLKGWTCIYQQPYSHPTTTTAFTNAIKGTKILIAARHKNSSRLALCAMGRVSRVLRETKENETTFENNVYFYNWKGRSMGFSSSDDINLGTADLAGGSLKLSWHLTGRGGYRCGELIRLNDSSEWEKLVFYAR